MEQSHQGSSSHADNHRGRTATDDEDSDEQVPSRPTGFCVHNHSKSGGCEMCFFTCSHGMWTKDCILCRRQRLRTRERLTRSKSHVPPPETTTLETTTSDVLGDNISAANTPPEVLASRKRRFSQQSSSQSANTSQQSHRRNFTSIQDKMKWGVEKMCLLASEGKHESALLSLPPDLRLFTLFGNSDLPSHASTAGLLSTDHHIHDLPPFYTF